MSSLHELAKTWNLTNSNFEPEEQPYILTNEDEENLIRHELEKAVTHKRFRLLRQGMSKGEVELRLREIDFDAELDKVEIFRKANVSKHYEKWQEEQRMKEEAEEAEALAKKRAEWSAATMLRLMRWTSKKTFGKDLIENQDTMPLIKAVCFFVSQDERFETELGYSLKKGLCIRGVCGLGKTHIVRCVAENGLNPIKLFSMVEISEQIKSKGDYALHVNAYNGKVYLDDVGSEEPVVTHYGTKINWLKDFFEKFYLRGHDYSKLIISTNCNAAQIEEKYGFRVRSRFKDMFNVIDVTGTDLRGRM